MRDRNKTHTHKNIQYDSSHVKFKNSDSETILFRNTYIRGQIIKKSKDIIIMNVRRIVASGEKDWVVTGRGTQKLLERWQCLAFITCMVITCMSTLQLSMHLFSSFYAFSTYICYIKNFNHHIKDIYHQECILFIKIRV